MQVDKEGRCKNVKMNLREVLSIETSKMINTYQYQLHDLENEKSDSKLSDLKVIDDRCTTTHVDSYITFAARLLPAFDDSSLSTGINSTSYLEIIR